MFLSKYLLLENMKNGTAVLLDLRTASYHIASPDVFQICISLRQRRILSEIAEELQLPLTQIEACIQRMRSLSWIVEGEEHTIEQLPIQYPSLPSSFPFFASLILLQHIEKYLNKQEGFYHLIRHIGSLPADQAVSAQHVQKEIQHIAIASRYVRFSCLCLHQSLALTWLLRRRAIDAHLVIGCRTHPFEAHAWVECCNHIIQWEAGAGLVRDVTYIQALQPILTTRMCIP